MKCPICSQTIKDDSIFCGQCGKKVPRCPVCGTVITRRIHACPKDGTPLTEDIIALLPVEEEETAISQVSTRDTVFSPDNAPAKPTVSETKKKGQSRWLIFAAIAVICVFVYHMLPNRSSSQPVPQKENGSEENRPTVAAGETFSEQTTKQENAEALAKNTEASTESSSGEIVHTYEVIASDITWQEAKKDCELRGGHLATITSMEEYETIVSLLMDSDLYYLWLGASLHSGYDEWENNSWITGESWTLPSSLWYPGEPSKEDLDGTKEYYLCLWNAKYDEQDIGWTLNDQRNDIVGSFPSLEGKLGYICEYETRLNE